ncbi:MAG TPA: hypothetical protein PKN80_09030, partial [bacterium]|nr:hypothetical protein [bacterium]
LITSFTGVDAHDRFLLGSYLWSTSGVPEGVYSIRIEVQDDVYTDSVLSPGKVQVFTVLPSLVNPAAVSLVSPSGLQGILPASGTTAVLGLNLPAQLDEVVYLDTLLVTLIDEELTDSRQIEDYLGIVLYRDDDANTDTGWFSHANDSQISLVQVGSWVETIIGGQRRVQGVFNLAASDLLPDNDLSQNGGYDYYLAVQAADGLPFGEAFRVQLDSIFIKSGALQAEVPFASATALITQGSRLTDLSAGDTNYNYSIPEELAEPGREYLITELAAYATPANIQKYLAKRVILTQNTPTAVLAISLAGNGGEQSGVGIYQNELLESLALNFNDVGEPNFDPQLHLAAIDLYRDNGDGVFGVTDTRLPAAIGWTPGQARLTLETPEPVTGLLPAAPNYFVVFNVGGSVSAGADFKVSVESGGFEFAYAAPVDGLKLDSSLVDTQLVSLEIHDYAPALVDATSSSIPMLGLNLADGIGLNDELVELKVTFGGTGFEPDDLAPLNGDATGGILLYRDRSGSGREGVFDPNDMVIPIQNGVSSPWVDNGDGTYSVTIRPTSALVLPDADAGADRG